MSKGKNIKEKFKYWIIGFAIIAFYSCLSLFLMLSLEGILNVNIN